MPNGKWVSAKISVFRPEAQVFQVGGRSRLLAQLYSVTASSFGSFFRESDQNAPDLQVKANYR